MIPPGNNKKFFFTAAFLIVLIALVAFIVVKNPRNWTPGRIIFDGCPNSKTVCDGVRIGNAYFEVEYAKTPEEQARGLSGRESLPQEKGMLFEFGASNQYGFWMKDMKFPIDIIWIADGTVADVSENLPPEGSNPEHVYSPRVPVTYVLEINAGLVKKLGIKVGDVIRLSSRG